MPKFIVSTTEDGSGIEQSDGIWFASTRYATDDAQNALVDMAREKLPNGSHANFTASVKDESGAEIYQASLIFQARDARAIAQAEKEANDAADVVAAALAPDAGKEK